MAEDMMLLTPIVQVLFSLRDEWLAGEDWLQYRIKEGYGALLTFFESEFAKYGAEICLDTLVREIRINKVGKRTLCQRQCL